MKSLSGAMLLLTAMVGCAVEEGPLTGAGDESSTSEGALGAPTATAVTAGMPAEAAAVMRTAATQGLSPLFYQCPPRITYDVVTMNLDYDPIPTDWTAIRGSTFLLNKPRLVGNPMKRDVVCGTLQSAEAWMSVRKTLPAGYTSCTTSMDNVVPAWFVCT